MENKYFCHESSEVSENSDIGSGTKIWNWVQVRERAIIGENCIISKGAYIDSGVHIGNNVKIQNNVSVYHGVIIEDGVFVGPHVCFTNDKIPRAVNPNGELKGAEDWIVSETRVKKGASIGANATILPGIAIGKHALIGSGSVVTKDVPDHALVLGNPAKIIRYICKCGNQITEMKCPKCGCSSTSIKRDDKI